MEFEAFEFKITILKLMESFVIKKCSFSKFFFIFDQYHCDIIRVSKMI